MSRIAAPAAARALLKEWGRPLWVDTTGTAMKNDYVKAVFLSLTFGATEIVNAFVEALKSRPQNPS